MTLHIDLKEYTSHACFRYDANRDGKLDEIKGCAALNLYFDNQQWNRLIKKSKEVNNNVTWYYRCIANIISHLTIVKMIKRNLQCTFCFLFLACYCFSIFFSLCDRFIDNHIPYHIFLVYCSKILYNFNNVALLLCCRCATFYRI